MSESLHFVRRIRTSPYFDRVKAEGISSFSVYNHMLLPKSFAMSIEGSLLASQHPCPDLGCVCSKTS